MATEEKKNGPESISSNESGSTPGVISVTRRRVMQVGLRILPVVAALGTGAGAFYNSVTAHDRVDAVTPAITQSVANSAQAVGVSVLNHEQLEAQFKTFVERTNYQAHQGNKIHEAIFTELADIREELRRLGRRTRIRERPAPLMEMADPGAHHHLPVSDAPPIIRDAGPPKE